MPQIPSSTPHMTSFLNKKGKITIPSKIRKALHFSKGLEFYFLETDDGLLLVPLLTQTQLENLNLEKKALQHLYEEDHQEQLNREL